MTAHFCALDSAQDSWPSAARTDEPDCPVVRFEDGTDEEGADGVGREAAVVPVGHMPFRANPQATIPVGQERVDVGRRQFLPIRWRPQSEPYSVEAGQPRLRRDPQVAVAGLGYGTGRSAEVTVLGPPGGVPVLG